MRKFSVKVAFEATDMYADLLMTLITETVENAVPDTDFAFVILPDEEITDEEWEREGVFENSIIRANNAGLNKNPLPEGMPKV